MSDLKRIEKIKLERLFDMGGGYVMEFSNKTFSEFIFEILRIEIYDEKYDYESGSKANRLRALWNIESNSSVGKLTKAMLEYWKEERFLNSKEITQQEQSLFDDCMKIACRLLQDTIVEEVEVIKDNTDDRDFNLLAKSIKESIEKDEPEAALDRLHTYAMKYFRQLCEKHEIRISKDESLNALFGKYVKFIVKEGRVDSEMAERILKYSINVLEAFNDIRNNKSFAHDNPVLNKSESKLIFSNMLSSLKFIDSIEFEIDQKNKRLKKEDNLNWDDSPF